ncbi:MAG: hypothetical protein OEY14_13150 [Myxococcales bacterium]|nr:hypothetical protein [Myxococcales bacterium]
MDARWPSSSLGAAALAIRITLGGAILCGGALTTGCAATLEEGHFSCTSDSECPSGWSCRADLRCWSSPSSADAGVDASPDAGMDASTDAVMDAGCSSDAECPGARCAPSGACVECLAPTDCPVLAPACEAGSCGSCFEGASCTREQLAREWLATLCLATAPRASEIPLVEAIEPIYCSDRPETVALTRLLIQGIIDGSLDVDAAKLRACRDSIDPGLPEICNQTLVGAVSPGGACFADEMCADGWCDLNFACPGVCVAAKGAGEGCLRDEQCASGHYCRLFSCQPIPAVGEGCSGTCVDGAFCSYASTPAICLANGELGATCSWDGQCAEPFRCQSSVCANRAAGGESCAWSGDCERGLRCVGLRCRAPVAIGQTCSEPTLCPHGARCVGGVCRALALIDDPCGAEIVCVGGTACVAGRCSQLPDAGESCAATGVCLRGTCDGSTCLELGAGAACTPAPYFMDALDPCGAESSCDADTGVCVANPAAGETCTGSGSFSNCNTAEFECELGSCQAICAPPR